MIHRALLFVTIILLGAALCYFLSDYLTPYLGYDAASYYYGGMSVASGRSPYLDFAENKNPGIFYLLALPASVFGWNPRGALILFRALELLTLFGSWRLLRGLGISRLVSALSLLSFWAAYTALFSASYETIFTEIPEVLAVIAAFHLLSRGRSPFVVGALLGIAFLFRQTALVYLPLSVGVAWLTSAASGTARSRACISVAIGWCLAVGAATAFAQWQGWLGAWWEQAFRWSSGFMMAFGPFYYRLDDALLHLAHNNFLAPMGIFAALFVITLARRPSRDERIPSFIAGALLLGGMCEVSASGVLSRHHFISWLPGLAVAQAVAIHRALRLLSARSSIWSDGLLLAPLVLAIAVLTINVEDIREKEAHGADRPLTEAAARWIQQSTAADEPILVWGYAPQLYTSSHRFAASRHYHYYLLTGQGGIFTPAPLSGATFDEELTGSRPRYIFLSSRMPIEPYSSFVRDHYARKRLDTEAGTIEYLELKQG